MRDFREPLRESQRLALDRESVRICSMKDARRPNHIHDNLKKHARRAPRSRDLAHLCPNILKTGRADKTEANDEDVGLRITQWSKSIVILLSGCIP